MNLGDVSVCFVCLRRSDNLGVGGPKLTPKWFCLECGPKLAKGLFYMNRQEFDRYEADAIERASPLIGKFVDEKLRRTDFADYSPEEWKTFLKTVVREFGAAMRIETKQLDPPF